MLTMDEITIKEFSITRSGKKSLFISLVLFFVLILVMQIPFDNTYGSLFRSTHNIIIMIIIFIILDIICVFAAIFLYNFYVFKLEIDNKTIFISHGQFAIGNFDREYLEIRLCDIEFFDYYDCSDICQLDETSDTLISTLEHQKDINFIHIPGRVIDTGLLVSFKNKTYVLLFNQVDRIYNRLKTIISI